MGNCLVTKLKGVVDNDSLQPYGTIKIKVVQREQTWGEDAQRISFFARSQTMTVNGNGYFATSYANLSDPAKRMTTYTFPNNEQDTIAFYFKNDNYDIIFTGRYTTGNDWLAVVSETNDGSQNIFSVDIDEFKYGCPHFRIFRLVNQELTHGDLSSLSEKTELTHAVFNKSKVTGKLMDLVKCTSLESCYLPILSKTDAIDFVNGQISYGRTTCNGIQMYKPCDFLTFGGLDVVYGTFSSLSWTSSSHIILTIFSPKHVYAKGATDEEKAQWTADGYTIHEV